MFEAELDLLHKHIDEQIHVLFPSCQTAFTTSTSPVDWRVLKDKLAHIIQQPQNQFSQEDKRNIHASFCHWNWSGCSGDVDADKWRKEHNHTEVFSPRRTHTFGDDSGNFLATGPQRVLQTGWNNDSCFNTRYLLVFLTSSSSCLRILSRLPITSMLPSIFPPITCFISQFLHKLWPIKLAFLLLTACRIFLSSLTLCNTSSFLTRSVQLISQSLSSTTFQNCLDVSDLLWELSWKCQWHIMFTNHIVTEE